MDVLSSPELVSQLTALGQVLLMDLVLAGDNAVAVGLAAAALPQDQRKKAILVGLAAAVVMRIGFALITVQLLALVGLLLAGGLLLLWVCWKMWRELREQATHDQAEAEAELQLALSIEHGTGPSPEELGVKRKSFGAALVQIMIADITMSLDNVLAVAGAAHEHPWIMVFGLILSIALMGVAATYIAKLLHRFRWIGYVGLVVVLYVALHMIWDGARQVVVRTGNTEQFNASAPAFLEIGPEEAAHHLGRQGAGDGHAPAPAEPDAAR
ncbi:YjbE family putative metal transport protein [Brevundimonas albigilva]|uniref:YjbE family putative metal transport protein n=1 Tax=Brevundimonas albigilva TaxID=1312364 RepID=A0ABY4SRK1_9CAUL|nr:YjbE family putative metal transport protein [Brevundimonas albigilva]UQV18211.1 YjbE family putative metal transport protein [Brevundimonas albigilva]URI16934.1 YjbE family putative metal transport protein [Brevundimonas albigilva]